MGTSSCGPLTEGLFRTREECVSAFSGTVFGRKVADFVLRFHILAPCSRDGPCIGAFFVAFEFVFSHSEFTHESTHVFESSGESLYRQGLAMDRDLVLYPSIQVSRSMY